MYALISDKLKGGMSVKDIVTNLSVCRNTVYKVKNGIPNKKRGVKKAISVNKITSQIKTSLSKLRKYGKKVSAKHIKESIQTDYSLRSVQRFLKECPMFKYGNVKRKIILNEKQKNSRLQIIKSWFVKGLDFKSIIFSDEARFSLDGPDNFQSWQLHNNNNEPFRDRRPYKGESVMVFGAITYYGTLLIRKVEGTLNVQKYLNLLKEDIIPELSGKFNFDFIFQQDGARPHTCKAVKTFFHEKDLNLLEWPSHSPDINLIENIWKIMKDLVYDNKEFRSKDELWMKILTSSQKIQNEKHGLIKSLYDNYVTRLLNVIERHGDNK